MADEDYIAWEMLYGSGEQSDDWQPPDWWIPVPEPGDYDVYFLIHAGEFVYDGMKAVFRLYKESPSRPGVWVEGDDIYCNWGDGTEDVYSGSAVHTYAEPGQYLVHIVGNETAYKLDNSVLKKNILIFKSGEKIICDLTFSGGLGSQSSLAYLKINDPNGIYINPSAFIQCLSLKKAIFNINANAFSIGKSAFQVCRALKQINFENCKVIGANALYGCTAIKNVSFPNVTSIGDSAFAGCYCLESVYLPNCTSVGSQAFYQCYNLQSVTFADGCTFGTNCFQNCYSLYPRPDGSTN